MISTPEIDSHLERAASSLQAANLLRSAELPNDSVSRSYYAIFHAASALLLSRNLEFKSHAGVLRAISLNFVKSGLLESDVGRNLNWLAELRQIADYGEIRNVSILDADNAIRIADGFLNQVHQLLGQDL